MNAIESYQPCCEVSAQDIAHLALIRENVRRFMRQAAERCGPGPARLLDVAPQAHEGARPFFSAAVQVETFDIDSKAGSTYVGDICRHNAFLPDGCFDYIVCTEVLEHTLQPFDAVAELRRLLKPGGFLFVSVPFNFRIHGPLPDCWRFTEHGLRALFVGWEFVELSALETGDRSLMPVHYTVTIRKPTASSSATPS